MADSDRQSIEVSERGAKLAERASASKYKLTIKTHDPTSQIVVLDDRFNIVAARSGSVVDEEFPAGIYKVRVRRGASSLGFQDSLVVLDRNHDISIEPPPLASPAPIGGTQVSEAHVAARQWLDAVVHVRRGVGSKIAILARYAAPNEGAEPLIHPFRGLQLLGSGSRVLVDLEKAAPIPHVPDSKDPISICGIAINPGLYILHHRLANGRRLAQSIVASEGWQITINIGRFQENERDAKENLFVRPGLVALLMRALIDGISARPSETRPSKDGPVDEDKLVDIARQGLADGARLLSGNLDDPGNLYGLLLRKFENPLAGILGGLLLDLDRDALGDQFALANADLFNVAVKRLREMVGLQHPDVEALSFRCSDPTLVHQGPIRSAPMFHRSWRIILEAASEKRNLVPLGLWKNIHASGAVPPLLVWSTAAATQRASLQYFRQVAARNVPSRGGKIGSRAESTLAIGVPANALADLTRSIISQGRMSSKPEKKTAAKAKGRLSVSSASKKKAVKKKKTKLGAKSGRARPKRTQRRARA